jgi:hypothetical protein
MTSSKVVAAFCVVFLAPAVAIAAGPSAQDLETARALYKEGKDLRAAGNLRGALDKLKAAHALGHTPITGIELARTEAQLALIVEAREVCLGIVRMPVEADESTRTVEARKEADKLAEELKPRIPSVRIHITSGEASHALPEALIVTVDGETVPPEALDQPRKIDPGHHVVTAHVEGGTTVSGAVDVIEGQTGAVTLAPPPAPITLKHEHDDKPRERHHARLNALSVLGIVVTGVGLLAGAAGGVAALNASDQVKSTCDTNKVCDAASWSVVSTGKVDAAISTIGFAVAGAGVVTLVIGLLTSGSNKETTQGVRIRPMIGIGQIGVGGAF